MHFPALAPACLVCAVLLSPPAWSAYDLQNYYPLAAGNSWTYWERNKDAGSPRWYADTEGEQIDRQEAVNGVPTWRKTQSRVEPSPGPSGYESLAWSEEGLFIHRMADEHDGVLDVRNCTTPLKYLPRQMEIGAPQQSSADCADGGATITQTLLGVENISVEAGNFSNCLKVRIYLQGTGWTSDETQWLCPGIGKVKVEWTDVEDGKTGLNSQELRWATVGGVAHGGERSIGTIRTAYAYGYFLGESGMGINDLRIDGQPMSAHFGLDPTRVFFAYKPQGGNGTAFPGVVLSNAYIRMNGTDLNIYDVEVSGVKYLTTWELQLSPEIGFVFKGLSPMPQ